MTSPFWAVTSPRALKVTWALDSEALVFPIDRLFPETVMVFRIGSPEEGGIGYEGPRSYIGFPGQWYCLLWH